MPDDTLFRQFCRVNNLNRPEQLILPWYGDLITNEFRFVSDNGVSAITEMILSTDDFDMFCPASGGKNG